MKKTSIQQLYIFTMISYILALICGIVGNITILIYCNEFISYAGIVWGLIFVIGICIAFLLLSASALRQIIILLKDYTALKSKEYVSIIGTVIGFKKNKEPESGVQINDTPIILILETNKKIVLNINDKIIMGETYKFNYLKNSKIAEITEK